MAKQDHTPSPNDDVRRLVASGLNGLAPGWVDAGYLIEGPGTAAVVLGETSQGPSWWIEIGFVLFRDSEQSPVVWTPATGLDLATAVDLWCTSTGVVLLEFLERRGRLAPHHTLRSSDWPNAWHVIVGPVVGMGLDAGSEALHEWLHHRPVWPDIVSALREELDTSRPNGVRWLVGTTSDGDEVQVLVDGRTSESATRVLPELPWPRPSNGLGYAKGFLLVIPELVS